MKHTLIDVNNYVIFDDENNVLLSINLTDYPNNQIVIKTKNEVYSGPIDFLTFSKD